MDVHDRRYQRIFFRASNIYRQYSHEGYDILTYLGDLGGLFEITFSIGKLLAGLFVGKWFNVALI